MSLFKQLTPVIIANAVEPGIAFWTDRLGFKITNQVPGPDGKLISQHKGETRAEVTVAEPLSDTHLNALKDALKSTTKKDVALDIKVDPSILGGLKVKLGSRMVDASLKTKLNSIKLAMKEAR